MTHQRIGSSLAVTAAAILAPTALNAVEITAGDWKFTATGNVNAHYIHSSCEDNPVAVAGGLTCTITAGEDSSSSVSNGLLPAALALTASTTQAGYDLTANFGLFPGISTNDPGSPNLQDPTGGVGSNTALGTAGLDIRQVFLTFGNKSMGTFMMGRNIGLFGQDAILQDMTLLGVGAGNGIYGAPANTSLGSIGLGYIYTDWLSQINYTTPDYSGLKFTIGIFDPLEPVFQPVTDGLGNPIAAPPEGAPGFHGKVNYTSGPLYLSATFISQKHEGITDAADFDAFGFDLGGKYTAGPAEFMAYYYTGEGIGTTGLFLLGDNGAGVERDSDGFIAQVTYTVNKTKFGVNYGESNLDSVAGDSGALVSKNSKITLGVYHKMTDNLTLVGEFTTLASENQLGGENEAQTINVGAFMAF
jgi:predicted porin